MKKLLLFICFPFVCNTSYAAGGNTSIPSPYSSFPKVPGVSAHVLKNSPANPYRNTPTRPDLTDYVLVESGPKGRKYVHKSRLDSYKQEQQQPERKRHYADIEALVALSEDEIDIGEVALILAKEIFPEIDIQSYSEKIDEIVRDTRNLTKGSTSPDYRIRALNTHLYKSYGMKYDFDDLDVTKDSNRYLSGLLDTRKGSCVTMPLLYLSVAQRLGYPVYPVHVPRHTILRYVDPALEQQNIETTGGGGNISDDEYRATLHISFTAMLKGSYLKTLTYREYLGLLIEQNGIYWEQQGDHERAIKYLETSIALNPRNADGTKSLGIAYKMLGQKLGGELEEGYRIKANAMYKKSIAMGVTRLARTGYLEEQKKAQQKYRKAKQKQGQ